MENTVQGALMTCPIKTWSGNTSNRCTFDEIPMYWKRYDILTFIIDLGIYNPLLYNFLDNREKEHVLFFKTDISRKRYILSRSILKHILLNILKFEDLSDIVLISRKYGGILVKDNPTLYISLSYSGTSIAITVGKVKVGSDVEVVRSMDISKIKSYPLFSDNNCRNKEEYISHFFHMWTLIEAYSKLRDKNPYPILNETSLPKDTHFVSYCINHRTILSLAYSSDLISDTLVWIDPECMGFCPSEMNKTPDSSNLSDRDSRNVAYECEGEKSQSPVKNCSNPEC